jgi:hypothetical protein
MRLFAISTILAVVSITSAQALQCTRSDGTTFSCFCTDSDGQRQFPEKCRESYRCQSPGPNGTCADAAR